MSHVVFATGGEGEDLPERAMAATRDEIERIYAEHPLRLATVRARVLAQRGTLDGLTERDLAEDRLTGLTDQNHVGGAASVRRLGRLARVAYGDLVADLGCGLGGPARVLAQTFGCRVEGIDLSRTRVAGANELTRLVGLHHLVAFRVGDVMRVRVPRARYHVLWGQGSWIHLNDRRGFLARWRPALRPGGRVAIEDACTRRPPRDRAEEALLARLEHDWAASLVPLSEWVRDLEEAGFRIQVRQQATRPLISEFQRVIVSAARAGFRVPARERRSWRDALAGARIGLIACFRIVADLEP